MAKRVLPAVLLACALFALAVAPGRVAAQNTPLRPAAPEPESAPLPEDLGPEAPLEPPYALSTEQVDPREGVHFGLGFPWMDVQSKALDERERGGKPGSNGVLLHLDAVWHEFRAGYARQLYRAELPPDATLDGLQVDALAFDSHQLWGFHGFHPHHSIYLGYGLGWQHRRVRVIAGDFPVRAISESSLMAGLMADWAISLPFTLELRLFGDLSEGFVEARGASLQLSFTSGF